MTKIYQFPQGNERNAYRNAVKKEKSKKLAIKARGKVMALISWCFLWLRTAIATAIHFVIVMALGIFGAFKNWILTFGILYYLLITYALPKAVNNPTEQMLIIGGCYLSALLAVPLANWMNNTFPVHWLLGLNGREPEKENLKDEDYAATD